MNILNHIKKHKALVFFSSLIPIVVLWVVAPIAIGFCEAEYDYYTGNYEEKVYGLPSSMDYYYYKSIKEKYNIKSNRVANCSVTRELVSYVDTYNSTMRNHLNRKYGKDIVHESYTDAIKLWELSKKNDSY